MEKNEGRDGHVDPHELLALTDWDSVDNCFSDMAPPTEDILLRLLTDDPREQGHALRELMEAVWHGNVVSSAAAPAARYVAAVLGDPRTLALVKDRVPVEEAEEGEQTPYPLRAGLLNWLGDVVQDAAAQQHAPYGEQEDVDAVLALAPELHDAVRPFLDDRSRDVREAAQGALLPLLALPALAERIPAHRVLVRHLALTDGHHKWRAIDTLAYWGEDLSRLL
ncbi:hypothetical protein [Streptomyces sp. NPDC086023]|uniref:hypothetical protein n=1 Tax=Streptomyces sp. NPDC086023 TaxID=3365746 RepID=UPI0037D08A19